MHCVSISAFVVLFFVVCLGSSSTVQYMVQPNDRILFMGQTNTWLGSVKEYGYVNIFDREVNKLLHNVTVFNGAFAGADSTQILKRLQDRLLDFYQPTKIVLMLGVEQFSEGKDTSRRKLRYEVESIVALLVDKHLPVVLFPFVVHGEKLDGSNELENICEEYCFINRQIARDYGVMYVDLTEKTAKYLEHVNIDHLDNSMLTLDGSVLNEDGHLFVAYILLKALGVSNPSSSMNENAIFQAESRVRTIKEDELRIKELYQFSK